MIKRLGLLILHGILLLGLVACDPVKSENPLGSPDDPASPDKRLEGVWKGIPPEADDPQEIYLHVYSDDDGVMHGLMVMHDLREGVDAMGYRFTTATVGDNRYMNLRPYCPQSLHYCEPSGEEPSYVILRYALDEDDKALTLYLLNENEIYRAVEAGELKGETRETDWFRSVRITDTPAGLTRYLKQTKNTVIYQLLIRFEKMPPRSSLQALTWKGI